MSRSSNSILIAPSILAADFTRLGEEVENVIAGGADWLHIDVMDGRFVPNISMGALVVKAIRPLTDITLDVHLMIVEPEKYVPQFAKAGANMISVHLEACPNLYRNLQQIRELGCQVGVAINPHTPTSSLVDVLPLVDMVNVMTVNPGFGGQSYITAMNRKITEIRQVINEQNLMTRIEVDGGVNQDTARAAVDAGADVLVAGTSVFKHQAGSSVAIHNLRSLTKQYE